MSECPARFAGAAKVMGETPGFAAKGAGRAAKAKAEAEAKAKAEAEAEAEAKPPLML